MTLVFVYPRQGPHATERLVSEDVARARKALPRREPRAALLSGRWLAPLVLLAVIAAGWELAKFTFQIPDYKLPHLFSIVGEFGEPTRGGAGPIWAVLMLQNAAATFGVALLGFAIGTVLGMLLAIGFAGSALLSRGCLPYAVGSQLVPLLAIAPMIVIGVGRMGAPDWLAKSLIAAYLTFFPVTVGMLRGLRSVPADALALMRSYAATHWQVFWKLRLPSSLPFLFTALKIAATASVVGAIVGELPSGSAMGMGPVIINASQYYNSRPQNLWAAVLVACLIGLLFYGLVVLAERAVVRGRGAAG
jgi:NitT/TauT family transport system permease protein